MESTDFSNDKLFRLLQQELTEMDSKLSREAEGRFYVPLQSTAYYSNEDLRTIDEWQNPVANTNTNTSLLTQTKFFTYKLTYQELEYLAEEPFVQNIINIKSQDIIGNKGQFKLMEETPDSEKILKNLEKKLQDLEFWNIIREASIMALVYGGALIYTKTNNPPYTIIPHTFESYKNVNLTFLRTLSPKDCVGIPGHLTDITDPYYMTPVKWMVMGTEFNDTNLVSLIFQDVSKSRKYYYNFLGASLIQKIIPFIRKFELVYNLVVEYLGKVRTLHYSSNSNYDNPQAFYDALIKMKNFMNNQGLIATSKEDSINTLISPINGFHEITNLSAQLVASVARIPATKLLGYSPLGLNNTGEYDLKTYYDVIEGYQKTYLYHTIVTIGQRVLWSLGYNYTLDFDFTPLAQESNLERVQRYNSYVSTLDLLTTSEIIDSKQAFDMAKAEGIIPNNISYNEEPEEPTDLKGYEELLNKLKEPRDGNQYNTPERPN